MPPPRFEFHRVFINKEFIDRRDWVKYLVLVHWHAKQFENILNVIPDNAFNTFVERHVRAYMEGTAPPAAIQGAVMNIVDDVAAGREVMLRAGDYIALQTQFNRREG